LRGCDPRSYTCYFDTSLEGLTDVNGTLFFSAYDTTAGYELWKSDGTPQGTVRVRDINPGLGAASPADLVDVNGRLFFSADDGSAGRELWTSDGTAAGTTRVVDLIPGPEGARPTDLASAGGTLFFAASDTRDGAELWQSDGTAAGTRRVQEIVPGPAGGNPRDLATAGGYLFFSADDGRYGRELWAVGLAVDAYLQAPARVGVMPDDAVAIPVRHGDHGLASAGARMITATLDPALSYVDDTTGVTPTIAGPAITWRLPGGAGDFALRVRAPDALFGMIYPLTLTLMTGAETHPADNTTRVSVMIARQVYLPAVGR
jgi:ELWxxDGT repeat protein